MPWDWIPEISMSSLILAAKGTIIRAKIVGDKGQPSPLPFMILKVLESVLIVNTFAKGSEYRDINANSH